MLTGIHLGRFQYHQSCAIDANQEKTEELKKKPLLHFLVGVITSRNGCFSLDSINDSIFNR